MYLEGISQKSDYWDPLAERAWIGDDAGGRRLHPSIHPYSFDVWEWELGLVSVAIIT